MTQILKIGNLEEKMKKEFELIKLYKDSEKIEFGVYSKNNKELKGVLVLEEPYTECDDCKELQIK